MRLREIACCPTAVLVSRFNMSTLVNRISGMTLRHMTLGNTAFGILE
jgi:hypothetical protein